MKNCILSLTLSCVLATSDWEAAYRNAYPEASNNTATQQLKELSGLSLLEIDQHQEYDPRRARLAANRVVDQSLNTLAQTSTMRLLEMAVCLLDPKDLIQSIRDAAACTAQYSCMSFWSVETILRIFSGTWCITKWMGTMDAATQNSLQIPYVQWVHDVVAPTWDAFMFASIPSKNIYVVADTLLTGQDDSTALQSVPKWKPKNMQINTGATSWARPYSAIQLVDQKKQECEAKETLPEEVWCMMQKLQELAHVRPKISDLSKSTFQAIKKQHNLQKEKISLLEKDGMAALKYIEDPIPVGFLETATPAIGTNPTPSPANVPFRGSLYKSGTTQQANVNYITANPLAGTPDNPCQNDAATPWNDCRVVKVPVGTESIRKSVGTGLFGMASRTRYATVTPGLQMHKVEGLSTWHANAKSMDGSTGVLYLTRGTLAESKFHIYMPGGYFCYNMEMCFERCRAAPMLCSTKGWENKIVFSGAFDPTMGGMPQYTHSIIGYTSSDCFLGDVRLDNFEVVQGTVVLPEPRKRTTTEANAAQPVVCEDWVTKIQTLFCHSAIHGTWFEGLNMLKGALRKFMYMGLGNGKKPRRSEAHTDLVTRLTSSANDGDGLYTGTITSSASATTDTLVLSGCSASAIGLAPLSDLVWKILADERWNLNITNFLFPKIVIIMDSAPIAVGPAPINGQMGLVDQSQALLYMLYLLHDDPTVNPALVKANPLKALKECYGDTTGNAYSTGATDEGVLGYGRAKKWKKQNAQDTCNDQSIAVDEACDYQWTHGTSAALLFKAGTTWTQDNGPIVPTNPACGGTRPKYTNCQGDSVANQMYGDLCVYSAYVLPFIKTPNLVYHTYWDSFALMNVASTGGGLLNDTTYAWGLKLTFEEIQVLDRGVNSQMMFGLNCYDHCVVENPWWWETSAATASNDDWQLAPANLFQTLASHSITNGVLGGLQSKIVRDTKQMFNTGCLGLQMTASLGGIVQLMENWSPLSSQFHGSLGEQYQEQHVHECALSDPNGATPECR